MSLSVQTFLDCWVFATTGSLCNAWAPSEYHRAGAVDLHLSNQEFIVNCTAITVSCTQCPLQIHRDTPLEMSVIVVLTLRGPFWIWCDALCACSRRVQGSPDVTRLRAVECRLVPVFDVPTSVSVSNALTIWTSAACRASVFVFQGLHLAKRAAMVLNTLPRRNAWLPLVASAKRSPRVSLFHMPPQVARHTYEIVSGWPRHMCRHTCTSTRTATAQI